MTRIRARGTHTWDIVIHYHRCPSCRAIQESREDYRYQLGKYIKDLECPKCKHHYTVVKRTKPTFVPFFGS